MRNELGPCEPPLGEHRKGRRVRGRPIWARWRATCCANRWVRLLTI